MSAGLGQGGIGIDARALSEVFPFHIVIDPQLIIRQVGRTLPRVLPYLEVGDGLDEAFALIEPEAPVLSLAVLRDNAGRLALLQSKQDGDIILKGQFTLLADGNVVFVGAPKLANIAQMAAMGLRLTDFPAHDAIFDFIILMQAQQTSMAEATKFADAMVAMNHDLEERVRQRTQGLQAQTEELGRVNQHLQREIADRERIEAELRLAQKLESVGQLAAGIAHEINTPIQFIGDNLRFLQDGFRDVQAVLQAQSEALGGLAGQAPEVVAIARQAAERADLPYLRDEVPKAINQGLEGIERVASLVRALKEFSHPDQGQRRPSDLNAAIRTTLVVARNEYKYVADTALDLEASLPAIPCVPGEINQVLLNLVVNAAHAIADTYHERGRGTITLSSRRDGAWIELAIADTGTGIPPAIRERIFNPFFTTKEVGRGTGQGLYLAHQIITKKHGGSITFADRAGGPGTVFTIRLPLVEVRNEHAA